MSRKKYKNIMGFTLVELIITIVIVVILSMVSVAVYNGYVKKAIFTEGKVLVGSLARAQQLYYSTNGTWFDFYYTSFCKELDIDARSNKYFKKFSIDICPPGGKRAATVYAFYFRTDGRVWVVYADLFSDGKKSDFYFRDDSSLFWLPEEDPSM
jgi:prepilin-type N-terminal cleavage/methylation domain-containing protein